MVREKILQLFQSCLVQARQGRSRSILLSSAGVQAVEALLQPFLKGLDPELRVFRCSGPRWQEPFYPFLPWVKEQEGSKPDLLDAAKIYSLHRPLLQAELEGKLPARREEVIPEELAYEQQLMRQGVARLFLASLGAQPALVILEDVNHYGCASLEVLKTLCLEHREAPVVFLLTQDERKVVANSQALSLWQDFRQALGSELIHLNLNASEGGGLGQAEASRPGPSVLSRFHSLLCLHDGVWLDEVYDLRPSEVDSSEDEALALVLADLYSLLGDYSNAALLYRNLLKWERGRGQLSRIILIYRRLGSLSFLRNNLPEAKKWASQALKLAQNTQEEEELFYALFLTLILDSREPFLSLKEWEGFLAQLVRLGESQNKPNNLAYRLSKPDRYNPVDHSDRIEGSILQAIRIASRLGNQLRLANAYHILGYNKLFQGRFSEVLPWYRKSETLRKRLGNQLELSYLYNGMGYFLHQLGDFRKAYGYLQKSVQYAFKAGDYHEICMGLCNIAINDLYSFQFAQAAFSLEKVIQIMHILGIKNLSFHSFREILLLYGVAMFFSGHPDRAYEKYSLILSMELPVTDRSKTSTEQDEILINALFQALMRQHENQMEAALQLLEEVLAQLTENQKIIAYRLPFLLSVLGDFYTQLQRPEEARGAWTQGLDVAQNGEYRFYEAWLQHKLNGTPAPRELNRASRLLDFDRILESARATIDLQKLHKVVEKIDILNAFRQTLDSQAGNDDLVSKSLGLINTAFPSDVLIFSYYRDDRWVTWQETASNQVRWSLERDFSGLQDLLFRTHTHLTQENKPFAKGLAFLPFQTYVHVPVGGGRKEAHLFLANLQVTNYGQTEDLKVLEIAAFQLAGVLEKRWKDEQLAQAHRALQNLAVTDPLTGLYNRGALMSRLAEERERTLRYGVRHGVSFSIVFIDLDNFKAVNDTYGHKIGDLFLQAFSDLLRSIIRNVDFPCRYGGDEFVVILPETSAEGSLVLAQRLLDGVKNYAAFETLLRSQGEDPERIPQEKRLGCSLGIAPYPNEDETDINLLLQLADRALYQAKASGKNQARIYSA